MSCGLLVGVGLETDRVEAELGVTARPGGGGVEAGEFADAAGDAEAAKTAVDYVVHAVAPHVQRTGDNRLAGAFHSQGSVDEFWMHGAEGCN